MSLNLSFAISLSHLKLLGDVLPDQRPVGRAFDLKTVGAAPLLPLAWIGAAEACSRLFWRDVMAGWIVVACVVCQSWFGPVRSIILTTRGANEALWACKWKSEMLAAIPENASVTAGIPYLSHLAKREQLHSLHFILKGLKTLSRVEYIQPPPTDVVLLDSGDVETFSRAAGYYHPTRVMTDGRTISSSDLLLHEVDPEIRARG